MTAKCDRSNNGKGPSRPGEQQRDKGIGIASTIRPPPGQGLKTAAAAGATNAGRSRQAEGAMKQRNDPNEAEAAERRELDRIIELLDEFAKTGAWIDEPSRPKLRLVEKMP